MGKRNDVLCYLSISYVILDLKILHKADKLLLYIPNKYNIEVRESQLACYPYLRGR